MAGSSPVFSISRCYTPLGCDNSSRYDTTLLVTIAGFEDGKGSFLSFESTTLSLLFAVYTTFPLSFSISCSCFENRKDNFLVIIQKEQG